MTANGNTQHGGAPVGDRAEVVITFTPEGESAIDAFVETLIADAERSPAGIADLLEYLHRTPVAELAEAVFGSPAKERSGRAVR